jgi:hypothetical protein
MTYTNCPSIKTILAWRHGLSHRDIAELRHASFDTVMMFRQFHDLHSRIESEWPIPQSEMSVSCLALALGHSLENWEGHPVVERLKFHTKSTKTRKHINEHRFHHLITPNLTWGEWHRHLDIVIRVLMMNDHRVDWFDLTLLIHHRAWQESQPDRQFGWEDDWRLIAADKFYNDIKPERNGHE